MVFVLRRKDFKVFESLFRIDGAVRRELDWEDFRQVFERLDFKQCNGHGSAHYFKAPHNGIITTDAQGRLGINVQYKLDVHFDVQTALPAVLDALQRILQSQVGNHVHGRATGGR
ncbi:hypothetical protein C8Q79DRAFT_930665 [Trametes meyenii]|nr:hypothetical protein C8Q79DRAFT_930665 [Trametes meyenii]